MIDADFSVEACYWECAKQNCTGWLMDWSLGNCMLLGNDVCIQEQNETFYEADFYDISECGKKHFSTKTD